MKERKEPLTGADIREVFPGIRIERSSIRRKRYSRKSVTVQAARLW